MQKTDMSTTTEVKLAKLKTDFWKKWCLPSVLGFAESGVSLSRHEDVGADAAADGEDCEYYTSGDEAC